LTKTKVRTCSVCKAEKPLAEFPRNRSKPNGRGYECLSCHRQKGREQRRKDKLPHSGQKHDCRPMMSDELFAVYYRNRELRGKLLEEARILARGVAERDEYARDLVQIAWMHISMCVPHETVQYYASVGYRAMWRDRWKRRYRRELNLDSIECMTRAEYDMWRTGSY